MQNRRRLLLTDRPTIYHVMSRTAFQQLRFGDEEKDVFTRMIFHQAAFSGIDVLGFCVMGNHVHLLIRVPPIESLPDEVLLERYCGYYGSETTPRSTFSPEELRAILAENGARAESARQRIIARMGDLPAFMRELKQRFTIWYNHKHDNAGTIWAARYKSVLVEDSPVSLTRVAAYLDLNPVRAGLVKDPRDYRWSGYAAALSGNRLMRYALAQMFGHGLDFKEALKRYRVLLFGKGAVAKAGCAQGVGTIPADKLEAVLKRGGNIPPHELLRMRVRYFTDGMVIGSRIFLETVYSECREWFGPRRTKAGTALPGDVWGELYAMRHLKKRVYSIPVER